MAGQRAGPRRDGPHRPRHRRLAGQAARAGGRRRSDRVRGPARPPRTHQPRRRIQPGAALGAGGGGRSRGASPRNESRPGIRYAVVTTRRARIILALTSVIVAVLTLAPDALARADGGLG